MCYLRPTVIGTVIPDLTTQLMGKYLHVAYVTRARVSNAFITLDSISRFIYGHQKVIICLISFRKKFRHYIQIKLCMQVKGRIYPDIH